MVTNNYWKMLYAYGKHLDATVSVVCIDGTSKWIRMHNSHQAFLNELDMVIGSGETTPTANDTDLGNRITNMSNVSTTINVSYSENGLRIMGVITGDNNTGSDVTITEAGIVYPVYDGYGNLDGYGLAARTLLVEPKTVPNGHGFSVDVEMTEA